MIKKTVKKSNKMTLERRTANLKYKKEGASPAPTYKFDRAILQGCKVNKLVNTDEGFILDVTCDNLILEEVTMTSYYISSNGSRDLNCGKAKVKISIDYNFDPDDVKKFMSSVREKGIELDGFKFTVGGGTLRSWARDNFEIEEYTDRVSSGTSDFGDAFIEITMDGTKLDDMYAEAEDEDEYDEFLKHRVARLEKLIMKLK